MKRFLVPLILVAALAISAVPAGASDGGAAGDPPPIPADGLVDPADPSAGWNPIPHLPPPGVPPDVHMRCRISANIQTWGWPSPVKEIFMGHFYTLCIVENMGPVWPIG